MVCLNLVFPPYYAFQVDEDVQRHNELFELVKSTPSGKIGDVVAKRRKDFTVEFFNHLYYVAESYKDEPAKQKGETLENLITIFLQI